MSYRMFEVFHYRQVLHLMQQNQSDKAIAKSGLMRRQKVSQLPCWRWRSSGSKRRWTLAKAPRSLMPRRGSTKDLVLRHGAGLDVTCTPNW